MLARLIACCLCYCMAGAAAAQTPSTECGKLNVAFYALGALYYRLPDGSHAGIDQDVIDELGRRSGCRFLATLESRVRIWAMLANGSLDMSVSAIATPERERHSRFIPYFVTRNYVLLQKNLPPAARSFDGFLADPRYTVAVVKSFRHGQAYDAWLARLRAQGRLYEAADFNAVLNLLKIGRVHAALALPTSWIPALEEQHMAGQVRVMDWSPADRIVHGLVLSRQRVAEPTVRLIERCIQDMRRDGTLEAIFRRHVGAELARELLVD